MPSRATALARTFGLGLEDALKLRLEAFRALLEVAHSPVAASHRAFPGLPWVECARSERPAITCRSEPLG
jgi:hypothetical protein